MALRTKKKETVFTNAEIADRRKELLEKDLGIQPISISEDGYLYDGKQTLEALKKYHEAR